MQDQRQQTPQYERVFAARMRELREARGLSQTSLAELLAGLHDVKLDGTAITRIERGRRAVRVNEAAAVAALFKVTLDEMLSEAVPLDEALRRAQAQRDLAKSAAEAAALEWTIAEERVTRLTELKQQSASDK